MQVETGCSSIFEAVVEGNSSVVQALKPEVFPVVPFALAALKLSAMLLRWKSVGVAGHHTKLLPDNKAPSRLPFSESYTTFGLIHAARRGKVRFPPDYWCVAAGQIRLCDGLKTSGRMVFWPTMEMELPRHTSLQTHTITVVPRYAETDKGGVVHHSVFPVWFEMGRTELLRANGIVYRDLEAAGVFFVVAELRVKPGRVCLADRT